MLNDPRFTLVCLVLLILSNTFTGLSALSSNETLGEGTRLLFVILGVVGSSISGTLTALGVSAKLGAARDFVSRGGPLASVLLALLLLPAAISQTACPKPKAGGVVSAKVVIAAVGAGVNEFKLALPGLGLDPEEARVLGAAADEFKLTAPLADRAADFPNLSRAGRARLAADVAEHLSAAVGRLSDQNVGLKSDKAKAAWAEQRARVRLAISALRVYAAAVEAGADPDAAPTPTPSPAK
jgi:hypothetical protein